MSSSTTSITVAMWAGIYVSGPHTLEQIQSAIGKGPFTFACPCGVAVAFTPTDVESRQHPCGHPRHWSMLYVPGVEASEQFPVSVSAPPASSSAGSVRRNESLRDDVVAAARAWGVVLEGREKVRAAEDKLLRALIALAQAEGWS